LRRRDGVSISDLLRLPSLILLDFWPVSFHLEGLQRRFEVGDAVLCGV